MWFAAVVVCCAALVFDAVGEPLTLQIIDCPSVSACVNVVESDPEAARLKSSLSSPELCST